jgi:epoxyqueuosine reductase
MQKIAGEGFRAKSCVDTQPVPERYAASRAGLGFIGKHTNLLSRKFGPWLFLSEIVTNLELEEDLPVQGDCGTCVHCQSICPTGALDQDYRIDARRCIAYLTIEHKGVIPREFRPMIKDWVFGCDECLNVCPFTSHSKESPWQELKAEEGVGPWLDLKSLFEFSSNTSYEKGFSGTALLRASRKQLLRNGCIVLGNSGKEEAIPYLAKALRDSSPIVRLHAVWGLGQLLCFPQARQKLEDHFQTEQDRLVREEIEFVFGQHLP